MSPAPAAPQPANVSAARQISQGNGDIENGPADGSSIIGGKNGILGVSTETAAKPSDSLAQRIWKKLDGEVDTSQCTYQLLGYCLITGWTDAVSFAAAFIFAGFQTGNTVQLAAALCRLFSGPDQSSYFHPADRLALTSLCSFVLGSMFGGQLGDRMGPKKRWWLIGSSLAQAGSLFVAFLALLISGDATVAPDRGDIPINNALGFVAIAFMSGSMGLQAIAGKRLNTAYGTTVVLTTIWTELVADPGLLKLKSVPSRDHRAASIFALLVGGFVSRAITNTIGGAASLGIGALLKVMIALTFYFVPSKVVVVKS